MPLSAAKPTQDDHMESLSAPGMAQSEQTVTDQRTPWVYTALAALTGIAILGWPSRFADAVDQRPLRSGHDGHRRAGRSERRSPYQPPWASHPPSTAMLVPVMNDASSLARNATVVAISRGSA